MDTKHAKPEILKPGTLVTSNHDNEYTDDTGTMRLPKGTYGLIEYPCATHFRTDRFGTLIEFEAYGILWLLPSGPERHEINIDSFDVHAEQVTP